MQLLHNWNQLHMRTAFEDEPASGCCTPLQCSTVKPLPLLHLLRPCTYPCSAFHWFNAVEITWKYIPPISPLLQGPDNRRHLLRLHLSSQEARPLDPAGKPAQLELRISKH